MGRRIVAILVGVLIGKAAAVAADGSPALVVPGRPDVPVIVNPLGHDASWTIVEGDFGLNRPAQVNPHIVGVPLVYPPPTVGRFYFPRTGEQPGYGRHEINPPPNRRLPPPAPTYLRSWSTWSDPVPASTDPPYPISISPIVGPWGRRFGHGPHPHP